MSHCLKMDRRLYLKWIGIVLVVIGVILIVSWPSIFYYILTKEVVLRNGSDIYEMWSRPPVPIIMDVYLFNYTNPEQLTRKDFKPHVVQMGPYRFREYHEKVDVVFHENHTVTYRQIRRWFHDAENSNGSLNDNITMLNVLPVAASAVSRHWSSILVYPLSAALRMSGRSLWVTRPVSEMLFQGFADPLLTVASSLPGFGVLDLPGDRIGFFYERNGSAAHDGVFNVDTGGTDVSGLGQVRRWNHRDYSGMYDGECGHVKGFAGELFPPGQTREKPLQVFAVDLCRWVSFDYMEDVEVNGVPGYRYALGKRFLDNGTTNADTACNCGGTCLPQGVLNVSTCRKGAPAFASYPHFLDADPYYRCNVEGLRPDPDKHRFHLTLEPITGAVLDITARIQVNLLLEPNERISLFNNVPTLLFPMMWFEERASISPELAASLKSVLRLPTIGLISSACVILLGLILVGLSCLPRSHSYRKNSPNLKVPVVSLATTAAERLIIQDEKPTSCKTPEDINLLNTK